MNIFILSECPIEAAQMQCNKHIPKMVVESAQMLSTAHRMLDGQIEIRKSKSGKRNVKYWKLNDDRECVVYKAVHTHHPCTVWTMASIENYLWHYKHFVALCEEYTYRYNKVHKSDILLRDILKIPPNNIPKGDLTPHALAMGSNPECIDHSNIVQSYRSFYQTKQNRFAMLWTKRNIPEWFSYANI